MYSSGVFWGFDSISIEFDLLLKRFFCFVANEYFVCWEWISLKNKRTSPVFQFRNN